MEILALEKWLNVDKKPVVISGPCSAESETQVLETARQIARFPQVKIFRSGIWKPRTRPNYFEGVGVKGLKWMKRVKEETGLLTAVEVAKPQHVEDCLKAGIDILWLGARTVVNPFSVQEITEVLKGVDIPVMVKNPVNPDLKLWMGAIERVSMAGVKKLVAVHRGFYSLNKTLFRNPPMWELPIQLKRQMPGLPVITDPSHICGNRNMLFQISQKAMNLEMDGLMIESHIDPLSALTDANQQITPHQLEAIINKLVIREKTFGPDFHDKLGEYRKDIDNLDDEMLEILAKRLEIVKEIGEFKRNNNLTILQIKRWSEVFKSRLEKGVELGMEKDFLNAMLEVLHKESIRIQNDILSPKNNS
jgi:chorismate mutase